MTVPTSLVFATPTDVFVGLLDENSRVDVHEVRKAFVQWLASPWAQRNFDTLAAAWNEWIGPSGTCSYRPGRCADCAGRGRRAGRQCQACVGSGRGPLVQYRAKRWAADTAADRARERVSQLTAGEPGVFSTLLRWSRRIGGERASVLAAGDAASPIVLVDADILWPADAAHEAARTGVDAAVTAAGVDPVVFWAMVERAAPVSKALRGVSGDRFATLCAETLAVLAPDCPDARLLAVWSAALAPVVAQTAPVAAAAAFRTVREQGWRPVLVAECDPRLLAARIGQVGHVFDTVIAVERVHLDVLSGVGRLLDASLRAGSFVSTSDRFACAAEQARMRRLDPADLAELPVLAGDRRALV